MLHRFADPELGIEGHDPQGLKDILAYLRACHVRIDTVDAVMQRAIEVPAIERAHDAPTVAITVDDGFDDVARIAHPVFSEFDCPYTVFVVPGVLETQAVFWWEQLARLLRDARSRQVTLPVQAADRTLTWRDAESMAQVRRELEVHFKTLPPEQMRAHLEAISLQVDVPLLARAPADLATLAWDDIRRMERDGVHFGAHTMTHPVLSQCDPDRARWEVAESLTRLRAEVRNPSRVFCYPNGMTGDFGVREIGVLEGMQMLGAVSAEPGVAVVRHGPENIAAWRWRAPRFGFDRRPGTLLRNFFE
jgi:peptidoglycan/xylan/chitin deacetylase (PgdA/CDA1 family)